MMINATKKKKTTTDMPERVTFKVIGSILAKVTPDHTLVCHVGLRKRLFLTERVSAKVQRELGLMCLKRARRLIRLKRAGEV